VKKAPNLSPPPKLGENVGASKEPVAEEHSATAGARQEPSDSEKNEPLGPKCALLESSAVAGTWRSRDHQKASFAIAEGSPLTLGGWLTRIHPHALHPQAEKYPSSSQTSSLAIAIDNATTALTVCCAKSLPLICVVLCFNCGLGRT
jgi:hypothetical protein